MSFRRRLTLTCAGGIALVLILGSAATYLVMRAQLRRQVDQSLSTTSGGVVFSQTRRTVPAGTAVTGLTPGGASLRGVPFSVEIQTPPVAFGAAPDYVELVDAHGKVVVPDPRGVALPISDAVVRVAQGERAAFSTDIHVRGTHLRLRVARAPLGEALLVARSLSSVDQTISRLAWSLGITAAIGTLLAALVGALVARGALKPVRELSDTAGRVTSTKNLGERIAVDGDDELSRLGTTFNGMLDSLEQAIGSQRQLVADASHELRTPLTSLRTNIDVLRAVELEEDDRARLLHDVTTETEELTRLVENLIELARGSQRDLHLEQVRLDEVAGAVVERARGRFPRLTFELASTATTVWGDADDLDCATWNLVENAAKWSPDGARIEVEVAGGDVTVRDHGPGIAASDRPLVFERFYRSDEARSKPGSGLGLAIVREVAERHGGTVQVETPTDGGTRLRLSLIEAA